MTTSSDLEELEEGTVFRLTNITHSFPPSSPRPLPSHFEPSTADKERALATHQPVLVSVFDLSRTSVAQAIDLRSTVKATTAFGLEIEKVRDLGLADRPRALRVVRDPLDAPQSEAPGAEGHCGIEGLHRQKGEKKSLYRALRSQLADIAFRLEP